MEISARNQFSGTVSQLTVEGLMAEVSIDIGSGTTLVSVITAESSRRLGLKKGDTVTAIVKSTEVMVAK